MGLCVQGPWRTGRRLSVLPPTEVCAVLLWVHTSLMGWNLHSCRISGLAAVASTSTLPSSTQASLCCMWCQQKIVGVAPAWGPLLLCCTQPIPCPALADGDSWGTWKDSLLPALLFPEASPWRRLSAHIPLGYSQPQQLPVPIGRLTSLRTPTLWRCLQLQLLCWDGAG